MATLARSYPTLCSSPTGFPDQEQDPRDSETADTASYLSVLRAYVNFSVLDLRKSQIKAMDVDFAPLEVQLESLNQLQAGWDGYDAPTPSPQAIAEAQEVLRGMQQELAKPQWISAAADGGVAFLFSAPDKRRAQVEVLNNGERFVHLYDLDGNSRTEEWQGDLQEQPFSKLLKPIVDYLQG
jgi:hypothetical protein